MYKPIKHKIVFVGYSLNLTGQFWNKHMKIQRWRINWNGADITSAISSIALGTMLITATSAPVAAQSVVVQRGFSVGVTHSPVPLLTFTNHLLLPTFMAVLFPLQFQ